MAQAGTQSLEALMPRCGAWTVFRVPQGGTQGMRNGGTQTKQIFFFLDSPPPHLLYSSAKLESYVSVRRPVKECEVIENLPSFSHPISVTPLYRWFSKRVPGNSSMSNVLSAY